MLHVELTVVFEAAGKPFRETVTCPESWLPVGRDLQHFLATDPHVRQRLAVDPDKIVGVVLVRRFDDRWPSLPVPTQPAQG